MTTRRHLFSPTARQPLDAVPRRLRLQTALHLAPREAGWLRVDDGPVWLTASGDPSDHVLARGEALWLAAGRSVVVEPWQRGAVAQLAWGEAAPAAASQRRGLAAPAVPALPAALRAALRGWRAGWAAVMDFAAAWRSAAPSASRAQGSISAGDSIASSGACQ